MSNDAYYLTTHCDGDTVTDVFVSFDDAWRAAAQRVLESLDDFDTPADVRAQICACVLARDYTGAVALWDATAIDVTPCARVAVLTDEALRTLAESKR